jgi:hypothetical protein
VKGFKKNTNRVIILVTFILSTLANCNLFKPQKVENDNLLYGLLILSQNKPLYSVVVTARLEDNSSIPIKDGLIKFVDSSSYLSADQGTLQDFTSCANDTVNAGTADSTIDGDFTILFKTASLKGNLSLSVLKSVAGTPTTTCSAIANYAPSAFTTSVGADATVAVNFDLNDRKNINQFKITSSGYTIFVKTISVTVTGEYDLQSPTVGENLCDGSSSGTGAPTIKEGTISGAETWSGSILLKGTVVANAPITVSPGTVIYGGRGASLFVLGANKLTAIGTATSPICWTSANSPGSRFPGDWGGIVVIGNSGASRTANTEGTTPQSYGGPAGADVNNLEMAYNIIEFGGNEVAPGDELNNLSIYASRSTLTNVQMHRGLDDQIEAWGGTGTWSKMLATGGLDDDFDLDEGFTGTMTNLIGHKYPAICGGSSSTDPHGFEMDGIHNAPTGNCVTGNSNIGRCTNPAISKVTLVGQSISAGEGMRLRESFAGTVVNAIIYNFASVAAIGDGGKTADASATSGGSNILIQTGKTSTISGTTSANLQLPIVSEGSIPAECGFGATKPDYSTISAYSSYKGGSDGVGKFWDGWAVFRAR